MSGLELKDYSSEQINNLKGAVKKIDGIEIENKSNILFLKINTILPKSDIQIILNLLWNNNFGLDFYDPLFLSKSDPGAYFSYTREKSNQTDEWSMTLGNQGWSGGIYHVSNKTLATQIENLNTKNCLDEIQITSVSIFSHYSLKNIDENNLMENQIIKTHISDKNI